jgi:hypothetical protein
MMLKQMNGEKKRTRRLDKNELAEFLRTNVGAELLPTRFSDRNSFFLVALCMFHRKTTTQLKIVIPGWAGKAKGVAQILWE